MEILKKLGENKKAAGTAIMVLAVILFFTIAYFYNRRIPENRVFPLGSPAVQDTSATNATSVIFTGDGSDPLMETDLPFNGIAATTTAFGETEIPSSAVNAAANSGKTSISSPNLSSQMAKPDPKGAAGRDEQRQTDMRRMAGAQTVWHGDHKRYYTCSVAGGDCRGKTNNFPASIGSGANGAKDPLNNGSNCGSGYIYCGLDNTRDSSRYCYYAKLETGGYYVASEAGSYKRNSVPASLADCSKVSLSATGNELADISKTTPQERDARRKSDMMSMSLAQISWYKIWGQYYTCGINGGNCGGRSGNYPDTLGVVLAKSPVDPINSGMICGRDQLYCGIDNTNNNSKFCYYAKLETGGYYTASQAGNFERSSAPATFSECAQPN